ncbi:hypothetical protein COU00_01790 [Candidatus Falkowbacteria bacterium CG10_big_fil_rev_8_21_14_0_10_43_11]|uniref:Uncharacterized protein n=1 Tax=Candidatus Falkowbacteria bacterium CG10_big_fil_rev_8_21_14_0_10_43_11 TaxID=1974568 RepID=A0A2M6WMA9_9BACT|nr:MAG: hypothetical protein COU00_01790 [Candidatus Falkowbacteria bacterium CG10_big_fil_rev_8_21_14_0_10_43_11]
MNITKDKLVAVLTLTFLFSCFFVNISLAADPGVDCANRSGEGDTLWEGMQLCRQCGTCTLNDFVQLGVNVANWILGVVGSLALLFFIYGGLTMIISSGKSESVQKAKTILTNAIIGLIIVFTSWVIINFAVTILTGKNTIFGNSWHSTPK